MSNEKDPTNAEFIPGDRPWAQPAGRPARGRKKSSHPARPKKDRLTGWCKIRTIARMHAIINHDDTTIGKVMDKVIEDYFAERTSDGKGKRLMADYKDLCQKYRIVG